MIPNYISFGRIVLSLILIFVEPLSAAFYAVYIICGVSDFADGFIARKTGKTSRLGARLDSIADMTMVTVLIIMLFPVIRPEAEMLAWIAAIAGIRLISMCVALVKYKTFASIHTYGNKITGLLMFLFPLFMPVMNVTLLVYILCFTASLSAIEELLIQVTSRQLQLNRKSIFVKIGGSSAK